MVCYPIAGDIRDEEVLFFLRCSCSGVVKTSRVFEKFGWNKQPWKSTTCRLFSKKCIKNLVRLLSYHTFAADFAPKRGWKLKRRCSLRDWINRCSTRIGILFILYKESKEVPVKDYTINRHTGRIERSYRLFYFTTKSLILAQDER